MAACGSVYGWAIDGRTVIQPHRFETVVLPPLPCSCAKVLAKGKLLRKLRELRKQLAKTLLKMIKSRMFSDPP